MDKIHAFDYMLSLFEEWYNTDNKEQNRDFEKCSKLSVLKLLFLVSVPKIKGGDDLLNVFNNFYALPYGPVESDIYNAIQANTLPSYSVTERSIVSKNLITKPYKTEDLIEVKRAVEDLKKENRELILLNAFDLVKITHRWESWKSSFDFAQLIGAQSYEMTVESIRKDRNKCFSFK